jgi:hypothetical protein
MDSGNDLGLRKRNLNLRRNGVDLFRRKKHPGTETPEAKIERGRIKSNIRGNLGSTAPVPFTPEKHRSVTAIDHLAHSR